MFGQRWMIIALVVVGLFLGLIISGFPGSSPHPSTVPVVSDETSTSIASLGGVSVPTIPSPTVTVSPFGVTTTTTRR